MLVSVDERIREIGLRRALGARKLAHQTQFLAETLLIMLLGGASEYFSYLVVAAAVGTLPMMGPLSKTSRAKAISICDLDDDRAALGGRAAGRWCAQRTGAGLAGIETRPG